MKRFLVECTVPYEVIENGEVVGIDDNFFVHDFDSFVDATLFANKVRREEPHTQVEIRRNEVTQ